MGDENPTQSRIYPSSTRHDPDPWPYQPWVAPGHVMAIAISIATSNETVWYWFGRHSVSASASAGLMLIYITWFLLSDSGWVLLIASHSTWFTSDLQIPLEGYDRSAIKVHFLIFQYFIASFCRIQFILHSYSIRLFSFLSINLLIQLCTRQDFWCNNLCGSTSRPSLTYVVM